jgi:hypothetical protein
MVLCLQVGGMHHSLSRLPTIHRDNPEFIKEHGIRRAFHTGGNSSCRQHIRGHYPIYKSKCEKEGIPVQHWAIPRDTWIEMQAGKKNAKEQTTLDGVVQKVDIPKDFTREGVRHAVTKLVACDDQVSSPVSHRKLSC